MEATDETSALLAGAINATNADDTEDVDEKKKHTGLLHVLLLVLIV